MLNPKEHRKDAGAGSPPRGPIAHLAAYAAAVEASRLHAAATDAAAVPRAVDRSENPRTPRPPLTVHSTPARDVAVMAHDATAAAAPDAPYLIPLETLYERFDAVVAGRGKASSADLHRTIVARLAATRRLAEAAGWSDCALERDGGLGRLRLIGIAPSASARSTVPDWTTGTADTRPRQDAAAPVIPTQHDSPTPAA